MFSFLSKLFGTAKPAEPQAAPVVVPEVVAEAPQAEAPAKKKPAAKKTTTRKPRAPNN